MSSTAIVVNRLLERLQFVSRLLTRETPEQVALDMKTDWSQVEQIAARINTVLNKHNTSRFILRDLIAQFKEILIEARRKHNDQIGRAACRERVYISVVAVT